MSQDLSSALDDFLREDHQGEFESDYNETFEEFQHAIKEGEVAQLKQMIASANQETQVGFAAMLHRRLTANYSNPPFPENTGREIESIFRVLVRSLKNDSDAAKTLNELGIN